MSDEEGSPTFVVHDFILGMKATGELTVQLIGDDRGTERHFALDERSSPGRLRRSRPKGVRPSGGAPDSLSRLKLLR
jgi:hypothetical protein